MAMSKVYLSEKYTSLPNATESEGKVVQYIGETTGGFVCGYFYKAVNGAWVSEEVQAYPIVEKKFAIAAPKSDSGTRHEATVCMCMWAETVCSMLRPGSVITSISLSSASGESVSGDHVRMVLWANDGGDHNASHNKMIGWSVDTPTQSKGEGAYTIWTFDRVVLPSNFKRLIVQLEPTSVSLDDIKNFVWGSQNSYNNLSVVYDEKVGDDGNQFLNTNRSAWKWGVVARGNVTTYATSIVGQADIDTTVNPVKEDVETVKSSVAVLSDEVDSIGEAVNKKADSDKVIFDGDNDGKTISLVQKDDATDPSRKAKQYKYGTGYTAEYDGCLYFVIPGSAFPYASVLQVFLFAAEGYASTDKVNLVLWDYDGSGVLSDDTCTFMCVSDSSAMQSKSSAWWQFTSDEHWIGYSLKKGHSLIVQGIPESVTPDATWKWSEKGSLYSVLSLKVHEGVEDKGFVVNAGSGDVAYAETSCVLTVYPIKYASLTDGGVDVVFGKETTKEAVNEAYKVGGKGIADILLDGIPSGVVPETRKINGKELTTDVTLYGTDLKAKEGSEKTVQEAALDDAKAAIKAFGSETYSFGDAPSSEFPVCKFFVLPFAKFSDSTISAISITAASSLEQDIPKRLVLWAHDGTGILSDDTCVFLGSSTNRKWQVEGAEAIWEFDNISLPHGKGLVIQGVPDGETIDATWTWYDKSDLYEVLSVKAKTVSDPKSIIKVGDALKTGNEILCSIVAVPRAEQIVKGVDVDVSSLVPNTRKVNDKALSEDITLTGEAIRTSSDEDAKTLTSAIDAVETEVKKAIKRGANYSTTSSPIPTINLVGKQEGSTSAAAESTFTPAQVSFTPTGESPKTNDGWMDEIDGAYLIRGEGIGTHIADAAVESLFKETYTFGASGASGDKFASFRYAIIPYQLIEKSIKITSISVFASPSGIQSGEKSLLLWECDQSGQYTSEHCTFLGKSRTTATQTTGMASEWEFDGIALDTSKGLIIQGIPSDATPTGDAWDWDVDSGRFSALSCKSQAASNGCIINASGRFFNHELHCIINGLHEGEYENVGQTSLSQDNKIVVLKANQEGEHPGVVSPSASTVPVDKTELDTAISGDKAIIKAYAPTATPAQLGLVKPSINGLPISTEEMTADIGIIEDGMIKAIIPKNLSAYTNADGESGFATRKEMSYATHYVLRVVTATETDNAFSVADGEHLRILFDGSYYGDVTITPPASVGDISQSFLVETTTRFTLKYNTGAEYGEFSRQYASWNNRPILVRFDSAHVISREGDVTSDCIFWTGTICDYFSVLPEVYRITPVNETSGDGGTGYTIEYGDAPGSHHYGLYSPWDV